MNQIGIENLPFLNMLEKKGNAQKNLIGTAFKCFCPIYLDVYPWGWVFLVWIFFALEFKKS